MGTTIKDLREQMRKLTEAGVTTKAALTEALPVVITAQERIASLRKTVKAAQMELQELENLCSGYVLDHQSVFDDGALTAYSDKTDHGDITIDDTVYHFIRGFGEPKREGGNNLTQGFLASLPENMRKTKYVLDAGACTNAELEAVGLYRPEKCSWL